MKKIQSRFGEIEYDPANVLHFPEGVIGFPELRDFVVMPNEKAGPLFWIQSVEDPMVAFVLTDPTNFFLDYKVVPDEEEMRKLAMQAEDDSYNLSIVTVHQDRTVTLNLQAPILYAPTTNRAIQVILDQGDYKTQTPLPTVEKG
jgi:flagellar assembly factor FliW